MKKYFLILFIILITASGLYAQQGFQMQLPVKCQLEKDCWVINYFDNDSTSSWHDYKGGRQTYDAHKGTDIAIKNLNKMKQGVNVLAAANGFVIATRNDVNDKNALAQDINSLQNIGCGNRVTIKHIGGWITDYCHMKKGSVLVKKGGFVTAGQAIGQIGMSGLSEFPHLHISVQRENNFVDPFVKSLWDIPTAKKLTYKPKIIYNYGVSTEIPTLLKIREGAYESNQVPFYSEMLIIWIDSFHVEKGDILEIAVKASNNSVFLNQKIVIEKSNAKKLMYVGKRKPVNGFEKGYYTAQITFKRPTTGISNCQVFNFAVR